MTYQQLEKGDSATSNVNPAAIELAQKIKHAAKSIRESSLGMRDTVKVLHESGAIADLAIAVRTAAVAARDTTREIGDLAAELKESGVMRETAAAVEDTTVAARSTAETVRKSVTEVKSSMPSTLAAIEKAPSQIRNKPARS